jgi:hypothetical protein
VSNWKAALLHLQIALPSQDVIRQIREAAWS